MFELREKHKSQVSEENKWDWSLMKCDWDKIVSCPPGVLWEIVSHPPALPEDTWDKIFSRPSTLHKYDWDKIFSRPSTLDKYDWDSIPPMGAGESAYRMLVLMGAFRSAPATSQRSRAGMSRTLETV